ncbi:MAG: TetR/AcrR family transcriptional regulator [Treponema sp.]|jgi:AcrR family transcriptional regulator|nr:TetR/AcrR family transcriptional regulator [Treponema sp.]
MNTKGDANRSVRDTKARVRNTFLALMREKHYSKITIRELTEKANINRSTFYLYYRDIYDLLDKIEKDFISKLSAALQKISRKNYTLHQHPQHTGVFSVLDQNTDLCKILMSNNGDINFFNKISETIFKVLHQGWSQACGNNRRLFWIYTFPM